MEIGRRLGPLRNREQWAFLRWRRRTMPVRKVRRRWALMKAKEETKDKPIPRKKRRVAFRSLFEETFVRLSKEL